MRTEYMMQKIREDAIDWQNDFANHSYYMSELIEMENRFLTLGKRYGLLNEFRENGIC